MEECAAVLSKLKPAFIHHPECKVLLPEIIRSIGGDAEQVYFDVPRLRSAYPEHYLTSGIAYAFHPHRDTWYSAPFCQINWWLPVWDIEERNCLAFHPDYFDNPVENSSDIYNYYDWNAKNRASASQHVKSDTREQPKLTRPIERREMRLLVPPGGLILFSAAHLHETVPNTSGLARYSIDFRTVHKGDAVARRGAANLGCAAPALPCATTSALRIWRISRTRSCRSTTTARQPKGAWWFSRRNRALSC